MKSYDFEAIRSRPDVIAAVPMAGIGPASGVAVVADSWRRAKMAVDAMTARRLQNAGVCRVCL